MAQRITIFSGLGEPPHRRWQGKGKKRSTKLGKCAKRCKGKRRAGFKACVSKCIRSRR